MAQVSLLSHAVGCFMVEGRRQKAGGRRQEAEGSPDETCFIAKHESGTSIFTQHSALSTFKVEG
ncbi:hypothetical protein BCD64_26750 [Nostoc sp. MBR 210]|nr:hypothetical protein BCD64_26750 [Nostoc sp. MBR 210]